MKGGEMPVDNNFVPQPLPDPSASIRLLQFVHDDLSNPIHLTMTTWRRADAPRFNAISYAWGEEDSLRRHILIDGKTCEVRENCYYALWQVRNRYPDAYVWIDSICINQSDLHEKGLQVGKMSELYSQAALTLSCIGPSAEGSESVTELAVRLENIETDDDLATLTTEQWDRVHAARRRFGARASNARLRWILAQPDEYIVQLNARMKSFAQRSYWRRVWVVQEIASAAQLIVLCGTDAVSWEGLVRLRDTIGGLSDISPSLPKLDTSAMRNLHMAATGRIKSLQSFISHFRDSKCADPRDRLFAFGALVDWAGARPIVPDYTKSAFDLVVELAEQHVVSEDLLAALGVCATEPGMRAAVRARQGASQKEGRDVPSRSSASSPVHWKTNRMGELESGSSGGLVLEVDGAFSGDVTSPEAKDLIARFQGLSDASSPVPPASLPHAIRDQSGTLIGWACNGTRAGDLLIPCNDAVVVFTSTTPYLLVLRHNTGDLFDIIGQAVLLADYRLPWHGRGYVYPGQPTPTVDGYSTVRLLLSAKDIVVLTGQDLGPERYYDPQARIGRLFTQVTANPAQAVEIRFRGLTAFEMFDIGGVPPDAAGAAKVDPA